MAHRNRWFKRFAVLKNGGSFHGKVLVITRWYPKAQPFELGSVSPRCQRLTQRRPWRPPCRPDVGPSEGPATHRQCRRLRWFSDTTSASFPWVYRWLIRCVWVFEVGLCGYSVLGLLVGSWDWVRGRGPLAWSKVHLFHGPTATARHVSLADGGCVWQMAASSCWSWIEGLVEYSSFIVQLPSGNMGLLENHHADRW